MRTMTIEQAAEMLFTTPERVSERIREDGLPATKVGRAWVLVDTDVIDWLRTQYGKKQECASTNAATRPSGGSTLASMDRELEDLLAPRSVSKRRNTPPRLRQITGDKKDSVTAPL